jgi:hypothetical protein
MLLKVLIDQNSKAKLTISYYGETHHALAIPAAFKQ